VPWIFFAFHSPSTGLPDADYDSPHPIVVYLVLAWNVSRDILRTVMNTTDVMDTYKLKIKLGDHEFEAVGPVDVVQSQFAAFRDLITTMPAKPAPEAVKEQAEEQRPVSNPDSFPHLPLGKIMKVEGRVVSLTAKCESVDEAVMLVLLGQKDFRENQEVTGAEIMDGLKQSGYMLDRVDKVLDKLSREGSAITIGMHRGRRYRLTNLGLTKALGIAKEVLATVP
jgi:hypothetical protein